MHEMRAFTATFKHFSSQDYSKWSPNPAKNVCRINGLETAPVSVELYDMNGKLIRRINTAEFDVSTLSTGIYMVRVNTGNRVVNLKMVKQ